MPASPGTYWHTLKHLRLEQWLGRARATWQKAVPRVSTYDGALYRLAIPLDVVFEPTKPQFELPLRWDFLNRKAEAGSPLKWDFTDQSLLWNFKLHYHDLLNSEMPDTARQAFAGDMMLDWIQDCPAPRGVAWYPYPVSVRLINWVKFLSRALPAGWIRDDQHGKVLRSFVQQTAFLHGHLELHLQANHLMKNAVALTMAASILEGPESDKWLERGFEYVDRELDEQILSDGGHYERSPMYHAIVLGDCLDLLRVLEAQKTSGRQKEAREGVAAKLRERIPAMVRFLCAIVHPDGDIALLNDSVFRESPLLPHLMRRALSMNIPAAPISLLDGWKRDEFTLESFPDSGYYVGRGKGSYVVIDGGLQGPDHEMGHAHCDTLSYELSLAGHRLVVDSGTFGYETGERRTRDRSTAAHNTVRVDEKEQSEIWASHRVARRAKPLHASCSLGEGAVSFKGAHDGYRRLSGGPVHTRGIRLGPARELVVHDEIAGKGEHVAESYVHIHPDWNLSTEGRSFLATRAGFRCTIVPAPGSEVRIDEGEYAPRFGVSKPNNVICMSTRGDLPLSVEYAIRWE